MVDSDFFGNVKTPQALCGGGMAIGFSTLTATAVVASTLTSTVAETTVVRGPIEVL